MKRIAPGFALILAAGGFALAQAPQTSGFTPLFDGKSLSNWIVASPQYAKNFSVKDGLLHIEGEGGWLKSSKQYGDFTLRLGFRYLTEDPTTGPGNGRVAVSGVFLRTPATVTYGSGWPDNSVEVQLANRQGTRPAIPGDARWGGAVLRHGNEGGPTSFDTRMALLSYGKTGEWQQLEIQAIGDAIHVTLNGRYLGTGSAGGNAKGYIGLQAENGTIEFRSIEIAEGVQGLATRTADGFVPLFDGKSFNGWKQQNADSKGFDIKDGALVVHGGGGAPGAARDPNACNGSIWTEKAYGDFVVRYQARFQTSGSVGGFFLRADPPGAGGGGGGGGQQVWNQIETRAMDDKLLPWNGIMMRGASAPQGDTMFDYRAATRAYAAVKDWTKDWVSYEVRAEGGRVTSWVNGVLVSVADDVQPRRGIFGLQCERETVEYRNIEIKELNP
jgi:hypothetical protein